MIGGNIPGETQVLSIALFDHVEAMDYQNAHILAGGLMAFAGDAGAGLWCVAAQTTERLFG